MGESSLVHQSSSLEAYADSPKSSSLAAWNMPEYESPCTSCTSTACPIKHALTATIHSRPPARAAPTLASPALPPFASPPFALSPPLSSAPAPSPFLAPFPACAWSSGGGGGCCKCCSGCCQAPVSTPTPPPPVCHGFPPGPPRGPPAPPTPAPLPQALSLFPRPPRAHAPSGAAPPADLPPSALSPHPVLPPAPAAAGPAGGGGAAAAERQLGWSEREGVRGESREPEGDRPYLPLLPAAAD
ncbi:unnamed protein product [Closterium sp. NIES-53]